MAVLFLTRPVDARLRLLEIAHTVRIKDHRSCRRERDAQTRRRTLKRLPGFALFPKKNKDFPLGKSLNIYLNLSF